MSTSKNAVGRMIWRENVTIDVAKAKRFYGALFGWSFEDFDMGPGGGYPMISVNGKTIGGLAERPSDMVAVPPNWISYVAVADADAPCAAAKSNGGRVHWGPTEVPTVGRMAMLADAEGAALSILQPEGDRMGANAGERPSPGEFCWETLSVANTQRAKDFWTAVLPWTVSSGAGMDTFAVGEGMENQVADLQSLPAPGVPANWLTYVVVTKIEDATARATSLGGAVVMPAMAIPGIGRIGIIRDDQGAALGLFEPGGI